LAFPLVSLVFLFVATMVLEKNATDMKSTAETLAYSKPRPPTLQHVFFVRLIVLFLQNRFRMSVLFPIFAANSGSAGTLARHRCGRGRPRSQASSDYYYLNLYSDEE
jgi:hypothetical protein